MGYNGKEHGPYMAEAFLSNPPQVWSINTQTNPPLQGCVGASSFVDDFASCWGKRGAYRLLLEPT